MSVSDDYKRGWYDGYNAKNKPQTPPWEQPYMPALPTDLPGFPGPGVTGVTCSKCGMVWKISMAYSCPHINCPVQPKATQGTVNE